MKPLDFDKELRRINHKQTIISALLWGWVALMGVIAVYILLGGN